MPPEKRKVQLTGGATLIVSLPIKWARNVGLAAGDEVFLNPQPDRTLLLSVQPKTDEQVYETTIKLFPGENIENNLRLLIAHYLVGYDIIKLISQKGFSASDRKWIKDAVRQRLIGLEVVDESHDELILQSLLNYRDLPLKKAMQSMSRLISSMHEDVIYALRNNDSELARDIIQRDNEVDRFYLLIVRQLKAAIEDPALSEKIGIVHPRECLGYRLIAKSMERIGDHIEKIARNVIELDSDIEPIDRICDVGNMAHDVFMRAITSLSKNDIKEANGVIIDAAEVVAVGIAIDREIRLDCNMTEVSFIIESLRRIAEYGADIAEISINLSAEELRQRT
ncbi:MAG: phosphate uptake regulator PhoU [Methanosarcinales archaeon]|nr:phosphate uptake regulator PhoU [Methanosarcinales archaeon]